MPSHPLSALSLALVPALMLAACAGTPKPKPGSAPAPASSVKIGRPYEVFGKTYTPRDDRSYDQRGIASWYGPTFHAKPTATGEIYNQDDLTAAHKTLPMPSWVEVTNLDNGRTLTVRINDRGPFVDGRIIDLSRRSAQLLGVDGPGLARVRVKRVFPKGDWALLTPPPSSPLPPAQPRREGPGVGTPVPPAQTAAFASASAPTPQGRPQRYIQVAALSEESRAQALASVLADFGPSAATPTQTGLWRVRIGPVTAEKAEDLLQEIRGAGYRDARLVP